MDVVHDEFIAASLLSVVVECNNTNGSHRLIDGRDGTGYLSLMQ
jgi:hypothetical protein